METLEKTIQSIKGTIKEKANSGFDSIKSQMSVDVETPSMEMPEFQMPDLSSSVDLSELEKQGIDTSEMKKAFADAQKEMDSVQNEINIDNLTSDIGIDIDGEVDKCFDKIEDAVSKFDLNKVTNGASEKIDGIVSTAKSKIGSTVNSAMSKVSSNTGYSFKGSFSSAGFRR